MKQNETFRFGNKCSLENFNIELSKKKKKYSVLSCTILEIIIMLLNESLRIAET